jgi:uncharacterized protein DUF6644
VSAPLAIQSLPYAQAILDVPWLYPAARVLHIMGFTLLVGSIAFFDLRVLGLAKQVPVRALARLLLPWTFAALVVIIPTGLVMFAVNANQLLDNGVFQAKMGLIVTAGLNGAFFHTGPYVSVKTWDTNASAPIAARISAAASLVLWIAVLACGGLLPHQ